MNVQQSLNSRSQFEHKLEPSQMASTKISSKKIEDHISNNMTIYEKSLTEPTTSRLWSSFIGRNVVLGPIADLLAIKAYDKGTMADLLTAHLFTTIDDTKKLVQRYDDKKNGLYIEPIIPKPKDKITDIFKKSSNLKKIPHEYFSTAWKKYGLPKESLFTVIPIVLFDSYVLGVSKLYKNHL